MIEQEKPIDASQENKFSRAMLGRKESEPTPYVTLSWQRW